MKEQEILELLPSYFSQLKQMREIAKSQGTQLDKLELNINDLLNQGFIKTATWGLRHWEERYGLPILEDGLNYEERRQRVMTKKRSNKADLVDILRAIEPTLELAWGGLTLPFYITFYGDNYNFGELIRVLEEEKPSHLNYSFSVKPNGYTVRAHKNGRYSVGLKLISGTSKSGRWPKASTHGHVENKLLLALNAQMSGKSNYPKSSGLVSGVGEKQTSFGHFDKKRINTRSKTSIGFSNLTHSGNTGNSNTGTIAHKSSGHHKRMKIKKQLRILTGNATHRKAGYNLRQPIADVSRKIISTGTHIFIGSPKTFACGTRASGEKVVS